MVEPHFAGIPPVCLPTLPRHPLQVVLDNVRSAYNVGSVFRTCDAGAVGHLHLCGLTPHPPHEKLLKTALGAFDYVPWTYHTSLEGAAERLGTQGVPLVAIENDPGSVPYCAFRWPQPVALGLGHEVEGVSGGLLQQAVATVHIPMLGYKRSLNVASAFAVVMFEVLRQWGALEGASAPRREGESL